MKVEKKVKPGRPGTKKWMERFGQDLICIRYCSDKNTKQRLTTAEIIIDKRTEKKSNRRIPGNKLMQLKIGYDEIHIRKIVKNAGGRWNIDKKVWELAYKEVLALGFEKRLLKTD
jgi:hypothetical protein